MTDISVVIPTVARRSLLIEVVAAFAAQEPAEILIVLDGPISNHEIVTAANQNVQTRLVRLDSNRGAGIARAEGVAEASSELILLVDDDILPEPGFVEGHRRAHDGYRRRVVTGYIPVAVPHPRRSRDLAAYECAHHYEQSVSHWRLHPDHVLPGLWAGNLSARRELLAQIEVPELAYFEDLDLGLRLQQAGAEGVFIDHLRGTHCFSKSVAAFVRESVSRGVGAAQLARSRGEVPPGIATNVHHPRGVRGRIISALASVSALPGSHRFFVGLIAAAGWLRCWGVQSWLAGAARMAIERRAFVRSER